MMKLKNLIPLQQTDLSKSQERGFTLMELMLVIVIIGLIAGIAAPSITAEQSQKQNEHL